MPNDNVPASADQNNTTSDSGEKQTADSAVAESQAGQSGGEGQSGAASDAEDASLLAEDSASESKADDPGAPEEYAEFTFPEGMEPDTEMLSEFVPVAKELGLPQEKAQQLVDFYNKRVAAIDTSMRQGLEQQIETWKAEVKKDPAHKENLAMCRKFIDFVGDDDAKALVYGSWLGSHPAVIRLLSKAGKLISEDTFSDGPNTKPKPKLTAAQKLYPNMK